MMEDHERQFAKCETAKEVTNLSFKLKTKIAGLAKVRRIELRKVIEAPYHDEARRWKHGDKVFFGKSDNCSFMSFGDRISMTQTYDIKEGQWCRVWEYQSRKKIAWLCHPGKPCEWDNIIDHGFTLRDLTDAKVSRTEIKSRSR